MGRLLSFLSTIAFFFRLSCLFFPYFFFLSGWGGVLLAATCFRDFETRTHQCPLFSNPVREGRLFSYNMFCGTTTLDMFQTFCLPSPSFVCYFSLVTLSPYSHLPFQVTIRHWLNLSILWPFCERDIQICLFSDDEKVWFPSSSHSSSTYFRCCPASSSHLSNRSRSTT